MEANNVENSYTPVGSERQVVNNYRIRGDKGVMNISGKTSHVSIPGSKANYLAYFTRIIEEIDLIKGYRHKPNFLDHFAEPVVFNKEMKTATPIVFLISTYELYELVKNGESVDCKYLKSDGKVESIKFDLLLSLFNYSFEAKYDRWRDCYDLTTTHIELAKLDAVSVELLKDISIVKLKTKFQIKSNRLGKIKIEIDGEEKGSFLQILNGHKILSANFEPMDLIYRDDNLYRERNFYKRAELILSIVESFPNLEKTKVEKFPYLFNTKGVKSFHNDSIFSWIEQSQFGKDSKYLICDDLGNEWADYIAVSVNKSIKFLHAKSTDKESLGASNFHVVVSQALKNIGNIRAYAQLNEKSVTWRRNYSDADINMVRKPSAISNSDFDKMIVEYYETIHNQSTVFESWLVVNFLSKEDLEKEIKELKATGKVKYHVVQLICLFLRYISACQDANVIPKIACCK